MQKSEYHCVLKATIKIVLISIVYFEVCLQLAAVFAQYRMAADQRFVGQHPGKIKILCLGESTTAWGGYDSYSSQLERKLNSAGQPDRFQVFNKGLPSKNSAEILKKLPSFINETTPDVVVLMVGINDYASLPDEPQSRIAVTVQYLAKYLKIFKLIQLATINFTHKNDLKLHNIPKSCSSNYYDVGITNGFPDDLPKEVEGEFFEAIEQIRRRKTLQLGTSRVLRLVDRYRSVTAARAAAVVVESTYGLMQDTLAYQAVRKICHVGLKYKSDDVGCRIYLGRALTELQEGQEAMKILRGLYLEKVHDFYVYLYLAKLYSNTKKLSQSDKVLADGIEIINKDGYCNNSYYLQKSRLDLQQFDMQKPELALQTVVEYIRVGASPGRLSLLISKKLELRAHLGLLPDEVPRAGVNNFWDNTSFRKNLYTMVSQLQGLNKKVVVMQYPRRPIEPLKEILRDIPGIVFVENVKNFETYLRNHKFEEAFSDDFGGDFGHFTIDGAELVAEAAFQAIMSMENSVQQ